MTKKLSIVRFKPKPEHFDEFVQLLKARHESDAAMSDTKIMTTEDEVVGIVDFSENVQSGVEYTQYGETHAAEYDPVNRHTIPITNVQSVVLTAWDKTLETRDFGHLSVFLSDDFQFEDTTGEIGDLANTESWCVAGEIRISNFKTLRHIVATHDVEQDGKPHSNVMVYAEQVNGKF